MAGTLDAGRSAKPPRTCDYVAMRLATRSQHLAARSRRRPTSRPRTRPAGPVARTGRPSDGAALRESRPDLPPGGWHHVEGSSPPRGGGRNPEESVHGGPGQTPEATQVGDARSRSRLDLGAP